MSRFCNDAYKWSLYEKFRNGFTLTELCEMTGVTDKPLREWFRRIDSQYAQGARLSVKSVRQENAHLKLVVQKRQNELKLLNEIIPDIPEAQRITCAHPLLPIYGPRACLKNKYCTNRW